MGKKTGQRAAGLDIGQASAKLVIASSGRGGVRVEKTAVMDLASEGILGEAELAEHLHDWLANHGLGREDVTVNLPQYMTMAHVADFPPTEGNQLNDMVDYEVQQLAGLSDESFLSGHTRFEPVPPFRNPVLIGVSREQMVRNRVEMLEDAGVAVTDLVMEGQALAATYHDLVKQQGPQDELRLVLDLGMENSTLVLLMGGQILSVGSIMSGGHYFTEALARKLGSTEMEAERAKLESTINPNDLQSPLTRSAENLTSEILTAIENWRHQALPEGAPTPRINALYICGAGSMLRGLADYLSEGLACPVHQLTVPGPQDEREALRLPIAYGLALQGLHQSLISFAPPDMKWRVLRHKRSPLLLVALILFGLFLLAQLGINWRLKEARLATLGDERADLQACSRLAPEVTSEREQIWLMRRMMLPFAAVGNRNRQAAESIVVLSEAKSPSDWFYLLADSASYNQSTRFKPRAESRTSTRPRGGPFNARDGEAGAERPAPAGTLVSISEFRPWTALYASGFTPVRSSDQLATVRNLISELNDDADSPYTGVDVMTASEISAFDLQLRRSWMTFMQEIRSFTLRLPFDETPIATEDMEE